MDNKKKMKRNSQEVYKFNHQIGINPMVSVYKTRNGQPGRGTDVLLSRMMDDIISSRYGLKAGRVARAALLARLSQSPHDGRLPAADSLPYVCFARNESADRPQDRRFTGLLLLTVDCPQGEAQVRDVRGAVARDIHTVAAFMGSSRRTVKVLVRVAPESGDLPADEAAYLRLLAKGREMADSYFWAALGIRFRRELTSLDSGCRVSADPAAHYNPVAMISPFAVSMDPLPPSLARVTTDEAGNVTDPDSQRAMLHCREEFYTCLEKALSGGVSEEHALELLATMCRRAGLAEEESVSRTLRNPTFTLGEDLVRKVFRAAYHRRRNTAATVSAMSEKERIAREVEEFFARRYELRFNVMRQMEEFRPRDGRCEPWQPLTDRQLRRIAFEQMKDVGVAWNIDIELYVRSALVADYNPVLEFLQGCGRWDRRTDHIRQMARRVPAGSEKWPDYFHRWFLAMVAQWMQLNGDYGNSMVPLLIGCQGTGKTTFCRMLLPQSLRAYFIDDVKMDNVEQTERMLSRMLLVNIDEYNAKTGREQARIKRLLAEKNVQTRRMRSEHYELRPRMASFIATTNDPQPLTDPTGSRRYLCCHVMGAIDTSPTVNYRQLYAQAVWELRHGERYHFTRAEEADIETANRDFYRISAQEMLLLSYFAPAERSIKNFMRAVDILQELRQHTDSRDLPGMTSLVRALRDGGFKYGACKGHHGWYVRRVDQTQQK